MKKDIIAVAMGVLVVLFVIASSSADTSSIPKLPSGPAGPGRFGAYYTKLKYTPEWDKPWRVGPHPDVVVRFDDAGYRFVFWRGTNYIPHWVTEGSPHQKRPSEALLVLDIWYTNEFLETWTDQTIGCCEPMSDKQCRYSRVRIIESTDARVVVHWRYALADVKYRIAWPDEATGWGDWADEYYIIYPDGVGVRKIVCHSSRLSEVEGFALGHEWHEGIVVYNAHTRPEESVEIDAVHVANMKGQTAKWSWARPGNPTTATPDGSNIVLMNVKSETKPLVISGEGCRLSAYEGCQGGSHFRWRDHWPTTMEPVTGRDASGERPAHGSFFHMTDIPVYERGKQWACKILLHGMTQGGVGELVPLAKSWLRPPKLKLEVLRKPDFTSEGYNQAQRAYVLSRKSTGRASKLEFELVASEKSPIVNPAFVIKNWGDNDAALRINGRTIKRGKDFRFGHRYTLNGTDLIVWLKKKSTEPVKVSLSPMAD